MSTMRKRVLRTAVAIGVVLLVGFLSAGAPLAHAQADDSPINTLQDIVSVAEKALKWLATVFWVAAIGFVLIAGYMYMTAAGNAEKVGKAKKHLVYTLIAIAIGVIAYGVPALVGDFLKPTS